MLYVGHFNFVVDKSEDEVEQHGYCTLVTDAEDVNKAGDKFKALLLSLKADNGDNGLFGGVQEIYMSSCVEVRSMPQKGFLTECTYFHADGGIFSSISTAIRGANNDECSAYGWENDDEDDEEYDAPFVVFGNAN